MALEKLDDVTAAYVTRSITLHLAHAGDLDQALIEETLKPFRITIKQATRIEGKLH
ncbi:MAG: hypothetical protein KJO21_05405 [Verrucomicrobiae bacterium]|nr:hypothetical protein [Verrucomicrobiae bacterium]NNJ43158.1 hypothetical protein [Akkermansiaceae bacterium]